MIYLTLFLMNICFAQKDSIRKVIGKKSKKKFRKNFDFLRMYLPGPLPGICIADKKFAIEQFLVQCTINLGLTSLKQKLNLPCGLVTIFSL